MAAIYPLGALDTCSGQQFSVTTSAFIVDARIDPVKVKKAASTLAKKWTALGGWMRRNEETSKVEFVVPEPKDSYLEVVVQERAKRLDEIALYTPTQGITTQAVPHDITLIIRNDKNISVDDYVGKSVHAFHLNITLFKDGSIFAVTHPHLLLDGGGLSLIVNALLSLIRGTKRADDLPEILNEDPFSKFASQAPNSDDSGFKPPGWTVFGPAEFEVFGKWMQEDEKNEGEVEKRVIYFPGPELERMKKSSIAELRAEGVGEDQVSYFSSHDIIVAWVWKQMYGWPENDRDAERVTRGLSPLDTRTRMPDILPASTPYLRNAFLAMATNGLTRKQVHESSLGRLALEVRRAVLEQTRREFVEKHVRWKIRNGEAAQIPWGADERGVGSSNWLPFNFGDLDFSCAAEAGSAAGSGKIRDIIYYAGVAPMGRGGGCVQFRDRYRGIVAFFSFGRNGWRSGGFRQYAYELQNTQSRL